MAAHPGDGQDRSLAACGHVVPVSAKEPPAVRDAELVAVAPL